MRLYVMVLVIISEIAHAVEHEIFATWKFREFGLLPNFGT